MTHPILRSFVPLAARLLSLLACACAREPTNENHDETLVPPPLPDSCATVAVTDEDAHAGDLYAADVTGTWTDPPGAFHAPRLDLGVGYQCATGEVSTDAIGLLHFSLVPPVRDVQSVRLRLVTLPAGVDARGAARSHNGTGQFWRVAPFTSEDVSGTAPKKVDTSPIAVGQSSPVTGCAVVNVPLPLSVLADDIYLGVFMDAPQVPTTGVCTRGVSYYGHGEPNTAPTLVVVRSRADAGP